MTNDPAITHDQPVTGNAPQRVLTHPFPRGTRVRFGSRVGTVVRADRKHREDVYLVIPDVRDNGDGSGGHYVPWRSVRLEPWQQDAWRDQARAGLLAAAVAGWVPDSFGPELVKTVNAHSDKLRMVQRLADKMSAKGTTCTGPDCLGCWAGRLQSALGDPS